MFLNNFNKLKINIKKYLINILVKNTFISLICTLSVKDKNINKFGLRTYI